MTDCGFLKMVINEKKYPTYRKPQCKELMLKCIHVRISIYKANPGCPSFHCHVSLLYLF